MIYILFESANENILIVGHAFGNSSNMHAQLCIGSCVFLSTPIIDVYKSVVLMLYISLNNFSIITSQSTTLRLCLDNSITDSNQF